MVNKRPRLRLKNPYAYLYDNDKLNESLRASGNNQTLSELQAAAAALLEKDNDLELYSNSTLFHHQHRGLKEGSKSHIQCHPEHHSRISKASYYPLIINLSISSFLSFACVCVLLVELPEVHHKLLSRVTTHLFHANWYLR